MLIKKICSAACAVLFMSAGAFVPVASAQDARSVDGIAAVVNDDIVTLSDLFTRINLTIFSANLPKTEETQQRIASQVLRGLIDERLKLQAATENKISLSDDEVDAEVAMIAQRNKMTMDQFKTFLKSKNTSIRTIRQQVEATLAWQKLIQKTVSPRVKVADSEVEQSLDQFKDNLGSIEFNIAEIFIPNDAASSDAELKQITAKMVDSLKSGAKFNVLASQFSQSASAANGGNIGWVQQGTLDPEIEKVAMMMPPGKISAPIRTFDGYHILWVKGKRVVGDVKPQDILVDYVQTLEKLKQGETKQHFSDRLKKMASETKTCEQLKASHTVDGKALYDEKTNVRVGDLPRDLADRLIVTSRGKFAQPTVSEEGVTLIMVCQKNVKSGNVPSTYQMQHDLMMKKIELRQRGLLRDLRRDAFIDIRL